MIGWKTFLENKKIVVLFQSSFRLKNRRSLILSTAQRIFFLRIDGCHCDRIHSSLVAVPCFNNGYVAWIEYCSEYWLKELQESMDRCTSHRNITKILLKTTLNTVQSTKPEFFLLLAMFAMIDKSQVCLVNSFPNKPRFLRVYSTSIMKTLWEKEKLLVTSNFSFFHSVFYPFG